MKKAILALALALLTAAAASADSFSVSIGQPLQLGFSSDPGYPGAGGPVAVRDPISGNTLFLTFGLEIGELFTPGSVYDVERIDTVAIRGVYPFATSQPGDTKPLAYETAFLYQQFVNTFTGDADTGTAYQIAIWKAQGQIPSGAPMTALAASLYAGAQAAVANPAIWGQTLGNVRVLGFDTVEWWNEQENKIVATERVTDTLVLVPEPASMLLLGTGLAGLIAARRRRR